MESNISGFDGGYGLMEGDISVFVKRHGEGREDESEHLDPKIKC